MISRKLSLGMTVTASGFFMSEPSLANTLQKETPTEMVNPSSYLILSRRVLAITSPLPNAFVLPVTSIQTSSMPYGSMRSV